MEGLIIETKYVVDLDRDHFCVERRVKYIIVSRSCLREGVKKKNGKKAVRLTAWVDSPSPSPEAVRKM